MRNLSVALGVLKRPFSQRLFTVEVQSRPLQRTKKRQKPLLATSARRQRNATQLKRFSNAARGFSQLPSVFDQTCF